MQTPDDLFKNRIGRIIASIFCKMGIHQNQLATNDTQTDLIWYCAFCGHVSNTLKNAQIKTTYNDPEQTKFVYRRDS